MNILFPLMLVLMIVGFYFMIIKPQKKRQAEALAIVESVAPGMDVMTTAGIYGTVTSVDDDVITLSVAPGVEIRYAKAAVAKIKHDELDLDTADRDHSDALADDRMDAAELLQAWKEEISVFENDRPRWLRRFIATVLLTVGQFGPGRMLAYYVEKV